MNPETNNIHALNATNAFINTKQQKYLNTYITLILVHYECYLLSTTWQQQTKFPQPISLSLLPLNTHGNPHASPHTECSHPLLRSPFCHGMKEGHQDASSRRSNRVAQSYGTSMDVHLKEDRTIIFNEKRCLQQTQCFAAVAAP